MYSPLTSPSSWKRLRTLFIDKFFAGALIAAILCGLLFGAPLRVILPTTLTIEKGELPSAIAADLKSKGLIRSNLAFRVAIGLYGGKEIKAGEYYFASSPTLFELIDRLDTGRYGFTTMKVTIPEGSSVAGIGTIIGKSIPIFDETDFVDLASTSEGYLFPDTYFFSTDATPSDVIATLESTFDQKIATIQDQITQFGEPQSQVVIMASLLESEAVTSIDRRIVAGILWKRLALGIPLELDSTLRYVTGKTSRQLTETDLQSNSPYNTYRFRGLPPTPIDNPGLESLTDAVNPTKTAYLYFLSGEDGVMHYATTLAEQDANEQKYLK